MPWGNPATLQNFKNVMKKQKTNIRIVHGEEGIRLATQALKSGKLVSFATETVYGLGADATNDSAVARIYEAKGRPEFNPLIIHVESKNKANQLVKFSDKADQLAERFWPGALTLILPRLPECGISLLASAGLDTLGIRVPDNRLALLLLENVGLPLAAPSANKSGCISPTSALHVENEFGPEISFVLDGGECSIGLESTIIDLTTDQPTLLRPGGITKGELEEVIGPLRVAHKGSKIKSPGMFYRHYAPSAALRLNVVEPVDGEILIGFGPTAPENSVNLSPSGNLKEAATKLFSTLRSLDEKSCKKIAVMPIPETGLGLAINDRLKRATEI